MRPRVFIFGTVAMLALLAALLLTSRHRGPDAGIGPTAPKGLETVVATSPADAGFATAEAVVTVPTNARPPAAATATNHAEYVEQRVAELMDLAMNDDANSLSAILMELTNPDKKIRQGALEAAVQFGDRSITPRLQELAALTEDAEEKAALLAAVEYINLPSLSEYAAEHRTPNASRTNAGGALRSTNRLNRSSWPGLKPKPTAPANVAP